LQSAFLIKDALAERQAGGVYIISLANAHIRQNQTQNQHSAQLRVGKQFIKQLSARAKWTHRTPGGGGLARPPSRITRLDALAAALKFRAHAVAVTPRCKFALALAGLLRAHAVAATPRRLTQKTPCSASYWPSRS
jgi:hypothetical protein